MQGFREQNKFLVYLVNFSGLYLKSIDQLSNRKWLLCFLTFWTKVAIVLVPIYLGSVLKFLIFDKAPFTLKMAVFRRAMAFTSCLFKNVFFYLSRRKIEALIDLWDCSFREDLYLNIREKRLRINQKQNVKILSLSWVLTLTATLIYTVPAFFSKSKVLSHPSGIPYRQQSPDYELMVVFDFFRVTIGCLSAVSLDCILMVFLSLILVQLTHLRDCLSAMIDEITVGEQGQMVFRSPRKENEKEIKDAENFSHINEITYSAEGLKNGGRFSREDQCKKLYEGGVKRFEIKMRIWIQHHQQVIRFFDDIKNVFTPVASLQLVYVVFYTCFTAFHLLRAKLGLDAFVIPFVAASNLVSLFVWCYMGVQIEQVSDQLFGDAFGRSWHLFPRRITKTFSFIIMRGRKPLTLKGISIFHINLLTFFQVFKITYQLFAFLLQIVRD